jgi:hypothetical protein
VTGNGVYGQSSGTAIFGWSTSVGGTSIHGKKLSHGTAVFGEIVDSTSIDGAVVGITNGDGPGVRGINNSDGRGVWGRAPNGEGIYGESDNGRGGLFKGKKAQLRLEPSTAITHPSSGTAGDIFLDKSKRLWLCKGGTTWVRLDT